MNLIVSMSFKAFDPSVEEDAGSLQLLQVGTSLKTSSIRPFVEKSSSFDGMQVARVASSEVLKSSTNGRSLQATIWAP